MTIGDQLAQYGPKAPALWLPPLDEPLPLHGVLANAAVTPRQWRWRPTTPFSRTGAVRYR